jgi:hypothetical protein
MGQRNRNTGKANIMAMMASLRQSLMCGDVSSLLAFISYPIIVDRQLSFLM